MTTKNRRRSTGLLATLASAALVVAACGGDDGNDVATDDGNGALAGEEINIAVFEGWDEGIVASFLMGHVFETEGASVTYQFADVAPVYAGVADGQFDLSLDAWLPSTHEDYWEEHPELESLGVWYDDAPLTIAVNEDAPITSLDELADNADEFGGQVVGIESGSGLNRITREVVFPTYGLEDAGVDFIESSTAGMLADLQAALDAGENVVVTLWRPHWAYAAFPIRDLDDPENALGDPEEIHAFGRPGFAEDFPEAADLLANFRLTPDELIDLEDIMVVQNEAATEDEYAASIEEWLEANPDWIDRLKAGEL